MPQHRQIPFLSLTLLLALEGEVVRGHRNPVIVGESGAGTRYYFEPLTEDGSLYAKRLGRQTVDGLSCEYVRHSLRPRRDPEAVNLAVYRVDDMEGTKSYRAQGNTNHPFPFFVLSPLGQRFLGNLTLPILQSLWTGNQLLLADAEEPAPNGVYYGFNEDGVEATVEFDGASQLTGVKLDASNRGRYNEFIYAMVGKAIQGSFYKDRNPSGGAHLLLEPVDREKFNGSRESFLNARINTIEGEPFAIERLPDLLTTKSKLKAASSRVVRRLDYLRKSLSSSRRYGKDFLKYGLLEGTDAE
ncbi:hypothetical protein FOZ60_001444 [Perkinsus olseni]|uniref:Uncharacterized protein n=1 Tax=Perkinsus olseni TaxID=32597 RepID=A0A7J6PJN0_PEROL|nr:hypothetical protein FOZ60_001444 [Perkinsus olseni]